MAVDDLAALAERMAGEALRDVVVNVSAGQPVSRTVSVEVAITWSPRLLLPVTGRAGVGGMAV